MLFGDDPVVFQWYPGQGLQIQEMRPCFLFSPYLYRLAPLPVERALEGLEGIVPSSWLCRVFWKLSPERTR